MCISVSLSVDIYFFVYPLHTRTRKYIQQIPCRYMISLSAQVPSCAVVAFLHPQRSLSLLPALHSLCQTQRHTYTHTRTHTHNQDCLQTSNRTGTQIQCRTCLLDQKEMMYCDAHSEHNTHKHTELVTHCPVSGKHIFSTTPTNEL